MHLRFTNVIFYDLFLRERLIGRGQNGTLLRYSGRYLKLRIAVQKAFRLYDGRRLRNLRSVIMQSLPLKKKFLISNFVRTAEDGSHTTHAHTHISLMSVFFRTSLRFSTGYGGWSRKTSSTRIRQDQPCHT